MCCQVHAEHPGLVHFRCATLHSQLAQTDALPALNLQLADETPRTHSKFLLELSGHEPVPQIAPKVAAAITCLRDNESVQAAIGQRHAFQLNDRCACSWLVSTTS